MDIKLKVIICGIILLLLGLVTQCLFYGEFKIIYITFPLLFFVVFTPIDISILKKEEMVKQFEANNEKSGVYHIKQIMTFEYDIVADNVRHALEIAKNKDINLEDYEEIKYYANHTENL